MKCMTFWPTMAFLNFPSNFSPKCKTVVLLDISPLFLNP